jgi:restriction system protein
VGEAYALQGYHVTETGGGGADGGVDLVLTKGGEKFFVQCKQWKAYKVGVDVVRELYGVMAAKGATGGFVVTSGRFTDDAKAFAAGRNVQLLDGTRLFVMIKQAKQSQSTTQRGTVLQSVQASTQQNRRVPSVVPAWSSAPRAKVATLVASSGAVKIFQRAEACAPSCDGGNLHDVS